MPIALGVNVLSSFDIVHCEDDEVLVNPVVVVEDVLSVRAD
jgi:hypothetical protein